MKTAVLLHHADRILEVEAIFGEYKKGWSLRTSWQLIHIPQGSEIIEFVTNDAENILPYGEPYTSWSALQEAVRERPNRYLAYTTFEGLADCFGCFGRYSWWSQSDLSAEGPTEETLKQAEIDLHRDYPSREDVIMECTTFQVNWIDWNETNDSEQLLEILVQSKNWANRFALTELDYIPAAVLELLANDEHPEVAEAATDRFGSTGEGKERL